MNNIISFVAARAEHQKWLSGPGRGSPSKNWLPFIFVSLSFLFL